jgi:hypothetical protein
VKIVFLQNHALSCGKAEIVIAPFQELRHCGILATVDATSLQKQGAAAFFLNKDGAFSMLTDLSTRGEKPWTYYE